MYKVEIDPITHKVMSWTKVRSNIPVYSDDILVEDSEIEQLNIFSPIFLTENSFEETESENRTRNKTTEIQNESEHDYLMRLLIDEEMELEQARNMVKERRAMLKTQKEEIKAKQEEHQNQIREFYLNKDREKDLLLDCKYYSAVIMVIKHENRYLKEWLDWHLNLGFDHIYLYDNGTEERVVDVVEEYLEEAQKKITVIDWSGHHTHLQQDAYNHFLKNYRKDVRWGIFIDSDEFVRFTDGKTSDVNTFLQDYEDYTEIWGYEVEYNANGQEHYEDKPVKERFTKLTDVREGFYWKNFIQVNRIDSFLMHYAQYNSNKHFLFENEERNKNLFVIEHYYTKSWEEWCWKIKERGGADPNYHKALQEFFIYNPDMKYLNTGEDVIQAYE